MIGEEGATSERIEGNIVFLPIAKWAQTDFIYKNMDYSKYYDLEKYLFEEVSKKFHENKKLNAFDFFCILIWKSNRNKRMHAERLKKISGKNSLDEICEEITANIFHKTDKMEYLIKEWKFRLPTASAILTVLYPDQFSIYDFRVCEILNNYKNLGDKANADELKKGYDEFLEDVKMEVPQKIKLRDKDKYLWGKSFYNNLSENLTQQFNKF